MLRIATTGALLAGLAGTALADVVPPREFILARQAEIVVAAGFPCTEVVSSDPIEGHADLRDRGLTPMAVVCRGGEKYLVATPPRRRPMPGGAPVAPPPDPVVRPLD